MKKEIMFWLGMNPIVRSFKKKRYSHVISVCVLILEHCHLVTTQTIWRLKE